VWDANHYLQAWLPCVNDVHPNDESWHVYPTTWVINVETRNRSYLKTLIDSVNVNPFQLFYYRYTFFLFVTMSLHLPIL
jgi:hypothetical protein